MKDYKSLSRAWGIFIIAVCHPESLTPEQSEMLWDNGHLYHRDYNNKQGFSKDLNEEIFEYREQGKPLKEISELTGLKIHAISKRISRNKPELLIGGKK